MALKVIVKQSFIVHNNNEEVFLSLQVQGAKSFQQALQALQDAYVKIREEISLDEGSEIWLRFFLSDVSTQTPWLAKNWKKSPTAMLCPVGQPPASGGYVSLLAYHIRAASLHKGTTSPSSLTFAHGGYTSIMANYLPSTKGNAKQQTDEIIINLLENLRASNALLAEDVIRTWYYIRDVDNNYLDMIASRCEHYVAENLRSDTHFIASTGIEAQAYLPWVLSWMTVLTTLNLKQEQISFLKALDHLSPTHLYGVNFERATRVNYGERAHIHLSGTASIDAKGHVVHVGDITKQCIRTIDNIIALLDEGAMTLNDMQYAIVYLRDPAEYSNISATIAEAFGEIPLIAVRGSVCRPDWLIEIEGLAGQAFKARKELPYPFYL